MYISNAPQETVDTTELLLIASEVRELMLMLIEQGEQATHDEISFVIYMMNCLIEEAENVGYPR